MLRMPRRSGFLLGYLLGTQDTALRFLGWPAIRASVRLAAHRFDCILAEVPPNAKAGRGPIRVVRFEPLAVRPNGRISRSARWAASMTGPSTAEGGVPISPQAD